MSRPILHIYLNGDGCWPDLRDHPERMVQIHPELSVAFLEGGMTSGNTSAMFRFDLPDGRAVLCETSLKLLKIAVAAAIAKYGDPEQEATS